MAALAMVVSAGPEGVRRQAMCERLWGRSSEPQARTNLRQALSALRKALGPASARLEARGDLLSFVRQGLPVDIDLVSATGGALGEDGLATLLEAGEFLEGFSLKEPAFDDWLADQRSQYHRMLVDVLESECQRQIESGEYPLAERIARKLISLDNFNEAAHRLRMRALRGCGETATALKHFDALVELFWSELGVAPGRQTTELAAQLRSGDPPAPGKAEATPVAASRPEIPPPADDPEPAPATEFRNIAVLAVDIADAAEGSDVTAQFERVRVLRDVLAVLAQNFGATEISNSGNSFLAVFGYPTAHSKDGERSVRCAQAARPQIGKVAPGAVVRSAVVSGIVLADMVGGRGVLGDPVRRAQALIHATPGEGILVDRGIYRATRALFGYEEAGPGIWRLAADGPPLPPVGRSEFVGRDRELRQAVDLLEGVLGDRRGEVVLIRGDAGIGKTRMSAEAAAESACVGFRFAGCRVLDFGQGRNDNSLAMVARAVSTAGPSGLNRMEEAIWADLVLGETSDAQRQLIAELDRNSRLAEQSRLFRRIVREAAARQPLLLIVEDVHWAEASLLDALADLAAGIDELPVALLMTTRPEGDPIGTTWRLRAGNTSVTTIDLQPLRQQAAVHLARSIRDLEPELLQLCIDRAAGNPLFIEQLVLWAEDQSETALPLSVQSVVQERIDRLEPEMRRLFQAASVLGQVFGADALGAVQGEGKGGLLESVRKLEDTHLVVRRGDRLNFVHALVRDGIYATIPPRDRAEMHARAADWFASSDRVLSARHHYWSGREQAAAVCFDAARAEHLAGRLDTALELAGMALEKCVRVEDVPSRRLLMGEVLRDLERFTEAIDHLDAVESSDNAENLKARMGSAECHFRLDRQDETMRLLDEAQELELAHSDAFWKTSIACLRSGVEFSRGNSELSIRNAKLAMDASASLADKRLKARVVSTLGDAEMVAGLFRSAERHFGECVDLCFATGLRRYGLSNRTIVSMLRFYDAELGEAYRIMEETVEEARSVNFSRAQMNGEHMLCYISCARGDYDAAALHWTRAREIIEATSARRFVMNSACYAAMFLGPTGEIDGALRHLEEAERAAADLHLVWVLPWALASRARWASDSVERLDALAEAERLVFSGQTSYPFEFYYVGIDAALDMGDWDRAEDYARRLEAFVAKEPVGLAGYVVARARAIIVAKRGRGDRAEISRLLAFAQSKGLLASQATLADALAVCGSGR